MVYGIGCLVASEVAGSHGSDLLPPIQNTEHKCHWVAVTTSCLKAP